MWDSNPTHPFNAWLKRKQLTVPAANVAGSGAVNGIPLWFDPSADADILAAAREDGFDVLFTEADGTTKIPHELLPVGQFVTQDGASSWFTRPRIIYHNGFITSSHQSGVPGRTKVSQYEVATKTLTETQIGSADIFDDHVNAGLLCRSSDSKLLAYYPRNQHNGMIAVRLSTNANDATSWGSETDINVWGTASEAYPCPCEMTAEGRIYLFARTGGDTFYLCYSTDDGITFDNEAKFWSAVSANGWGVRPYGMCIGNGVDRMDFLFSTGDGTSGNGSQKLVHCYYDGAWRTSDGTGIGHGPPFTVAELTTIADLTAGSDTVWLGDIQYQQNGEPKILYVVYPGGTASNQDLYYGEWNGSSWDTGKVLDEGDGSWLLTPSTYHGASCLDPDDDNTIWVSTKVTGLFGDIYEIRKYTGGFGAWALATDGVITKDSAFPHARPVVAMGAPLMTPGRVQFMSQTAYTTYDNYVGGISAYPALTNGMRRAYIKADVDGTTDTDFYCYYGNAAAANQEDVAGVWSDYFYVYHTQRHYGAAPFYYQDSCGNGNEIKEADGGEDASSTVGASINPVTFRATNGQANIGTPTTLGWTAESGECWFKVTQTTDGTFPLWAQDGIHQITSFIRRVSAVWTSYDFLRKEDDTPIGGDAATVVPVPNVWTYKNQSWTPGGGTKVRLDKVEGAVASTTGTSLGSAAAEPMHLGWYTDAAVDLIGLMAEFRLKENAALTKDQTDTQWDNWDQGNAFFTIGAEEEQLTAINRLYIKSYRPRPFCPAKEKAIQGAIN